MLNGISPKVSLVTVTYNRADLIDRSIESIINQTFTDWEMIIVNNGSVDNTKEILSKYEIPEFEDKIRIFHLEENRRYAGGVNFGMDQIRGEWFSWHDDDDELVPECLETLLKIPEEIDPSINAITCNCLDTTTKEFSGIGPQSDGFLTYEDIMTSCEGEFWGITKTELLGDKRLNEELRGFENTLWNQIDRIAKRYYVHQPLRIWYTDHDATMTKNLRKKDIKVKASIYRELSKDPYYWEDLKQFKPEKYKSKLIKAMLYLYADGDIELAKFYVKKLKNESNSIKDSLLTKVAGALPQPLLKSLIQAMPSS